MKLFLSVRKPLPQVCHMSPDECREAFMHASKSWRNSNPVDQEKIGAYIDAVLDQHLALQ